MTHQTATALLVRKLRIGTELDDDDVRAIEHLPTAIKQISAGHCIAREGDRQVHCSLLVTGFLYGAKITGDGRRQILSIHIPGEIPDLQSLHLGLLDHDLCALSPVRIAIISHEALRNLVDTRPKVAAAMWRATLVDASIFREWIVVGRRPAATRIAHLLSELAERLKAAGLAHDDSFELPMTQIDLADALGISPVHVNRVIMQLRRDGMLEMRRFAVRLGDAARLRALGDFDELYLHQSWAAGELVKPPSLRVTA